MSIVSLLWVWHLSFTFLIICTSNIKEEIWQVHIQSVNLFHISSKVPAGSRLIFPIKNSGSGLAGGSGWLERYAPNTKVASLIPTEVSELRLYS